MATAPTLTRRLLRTKQAAAYLSMSEWKLRRLIQSAIFPIVQDHDGGPFLLDVQDLDAGIRTTVVIPTTITNKHIIKMKNGYLIAKEDITAPPPDPASRL